MIQHAGQRDTLVIIQRATVTRGSLNGKNKSWAEHGRAYAAVRYGSGRERLEAATMGSEQGATFTVRSTEAMRQVTIADRLLEAGDVWNIVAVAPIGRGMIQFTCQRSAD